MENFQCLLARKQGENISCALEQLNTKDLPDGDIVLRVEYSCVNYKDAMAVTGKGKVLKTFPIVPGIDLAGEVVESNSPNIKTGDTVLIDGFGIGEEHWGGYTQMTRVNGDWLVPVPGPFSTRHAMMIGTAGYTAALAVLALEHGGVKPDDGPVLVTGATGGVGTISIALLSRLGFEVVAATGKASEETYLRKIGASEIIDRQEISQAPARPLLSARWAGAVDAAGGSTLANIIASLERGGVVAACGVAAGYEVPTNIVPFALRGVTVAGIDSNWRPLPERMNAWALLADNVPVEFLETNSQTIGLADVLKIAPDFLAGKIRGRYVVDVNA